MARKNVSFDRNPLLSGPSLEERTKGGSPYRELDIADVDVDPAQPRRNFDPESLAELALSIKEHGVLCPILVRVSPGGTYRLVAGERRLRAAKMAGLERIPAVIDSGEETGPATLAKQLVENLQRADLSPLERAEAIGELKENHSWSIREIASRLGISKGVVQRSLEILLLPAELKEALRLGASESKVLLIAQVEDLELRNKLLGSLSELTREDIEREIRQFKSASKVYHGGTSKAADEPTVEDKRIADDIQRSLGTRVEIARRKGRDGQGKLTIHFYSPDDLTEIYRRLT